MTRIVTVLDRAAGRALDALAIALVWCSREQRPHRAAAALTEAGAFLFLWALVTALAGPTWSLLPLAVYLLLQSIAYRRAADRGGR